ncbi:sulfurtransferase [Parendozoicomonas haliclonae]|uniref:Thiosulfate sulfurtransferase n=1 Tax=Parendozoicomonas haliclonae TaxID=1960125 RepID=A0A1X7ARZ1_9GAMM|nr:rhodanese-like domain-containing protein [Parendozoicomonas haliclonae]SMA50868.1 Thiosulfate sulfurtransferase [Parendozoicomonas haliclonae]
MSSTELPCASPLPAVELLEPEQLLTRLEQSDVLVLDVCNPATYQKLHVPGAVHIAPGELVCGIPPATGMLPAMEQVQAVLNRVGYNPDKLIVVYDDEGGGWAGRLLWTLDLIGHQRLAYLNGGLHAWLKARLPVQEQTVAVEASDFDLTITNPQLRVSAEQIIADLASDSPAITIWDARSPGEYTGEKQFAMRAGHIPGAINFEWTMGMDASRQYRLREDMAQVLEELNLGPDKTIVTHCQTHHRSGFTYLAARLLGYPDIRAYDGSWSEWGNRQDTPITT